MLNVGVARTRVKEMLNVGVARTRVKKMLNVGVARTRVGVWDQDAVTAGGRWECHREAIEKKDYNLGKRKCVWI